MQTPEGGVSSLTRGNGVRPTAQRIWNPLLPRRRCGSVGSDLRAGVSGVSSADARAWPVRRLLGLIHGRGAAHGRRREEILHDVGGWHLSGGRGAIDWGHTALPR